MAKIILEVQKCIGCGSCEAVCSKFWKLGDSGKVQLLGSQANSDNFELEVKNIECNSEAVETCPVQCIKVEK
ncbi:MAG: ferredoxin [Candidatus Nealsonbacteria bacterium]